MIMENIFSEILEMSINSSWLILAVIVCRALLQKAPMYFRKILWGLVGVRLLLPFSFESVFSLIPHKTVQTAQGAVGQIVTQPAEIGVSVADVMPVIWAAISITLLVYGIISYIKLKLKIIDGILLEDNIYHSDRIQSPFVCGFIKPKIYIPYGLDEVTQKCVLQHEKTHIKFADHIIKALSFVILCVHWFNPLVWVAYFLLCKDIELSCDESVIKKYNTSECKEYAKALMQLGVNKVKFTACPVAFGEVSIKKRITSVINYKKAGRMLIVASLALCVAVAICFMTEPEVKAKDVETIKPIVEETTEPISETEKVEETKTTTPTVAENNVTQNTTKTEITTEPATDDKTEPVTEPYSEKYIFDVIDVTAPETYNYTIENTMPYALVGEPYEYVYEDVSIPNFFSEDVEGNISGDSLNPYFPN